MVPEWEDRVDPTLASCRVESPTPSEKEGKSKGENDDLEARHLPSKCDIFNRHICDIFNRR